MAKKFLRKSSPSPAPQAHTRRAHRGWSMRPLDDLRVDGGTQSRVCLDEEVVAEYAERMRRDERSGLVLDEQDEPWPALTAFDDGQVLWLVDGFHRLRAARAAGLDAIQLDVKPGERRDAVRLSLSVNARHGLRRTRADKRRAIERALADEEWVTYSDRKLGELCAVSPRTIARVRAELEADGAIDEQTERVARDGTLQDVSTSIKRAPRARPGASARARLNRRGLDPDALAHALAIPCVPAAELDTRATELEARPGVVVTGSARGSGAISAIVDHLPALLASQGVLVAPMPMLLTQPAIMTRLAGALGAPVGVVLERSRDVVLVYGAPDDLDLPTWSPGMGALIERLGLDAPHLMHVEVGAPAR